MKQVENLIDKIWVKNLWPIPKSFVLSHRTDDLWLNFLIEQLDKNTKK